jgi:hypothetical protein
MLNVVILSAMHASGKCSQLLRSESRIIAVRTLHFFQKALAHFEIAVSYARKMFMTLIPDDFLRLGQRLEPIELVLRADGTAPAGNSINMLSPFSLAKVFVPCNIFI